MSLFWIAGIAINVIAMAALIAWARKAWKHADDERRRRDTDR